MINTAEQREIEAGERISRVDDETPAKLRQRIELLLPDDRLLVELIMGGTISRRQAAQLMKLGTGTVTRRMQRIGARLHDPIVRHLMEPKCPLPPDYRQIGVEHFLAGLSSKKLAAKHGITSGEVSRMIEYVRGWHRGLSQRRR